MNVDSLRRAMVVRGSKSHHHPRYKKVTVLLAANEVICNARSHITKNAATTIQRLVRECPRVDSGVWWFQRRVNGLSI
jgi:hypothetical protein